LAGAYNLLKVKDCGAIKCNHGYMSISEGGRTPGTLKLINVNADTCLVGVELDGGSIAQVGAAVLDAGARGVAVSSTFDGVVTVAGCLITGHVNNGIEVGTPGSPHRPSPAVVAIIGNAVTGQVRGDGIWITSAPLGLVTITGTLVRNVPDSGQAAMRVSGYNQGTVVIDAVGQGNMTVGQQHGLIIEGTAHGVSPAGTCLVNGSVFDRDRPNQFITVPGQATPPSVPPQRIYDAPFYNPTGLLPAPPLSSPTTLTNTFGVDAVVYVSGSSISSITVDGHDTALKIGPISVPVGSTIAVTFTGAASWVWIGN
jgi:hypothetical protein